MYVVYYTLSAQLEQNTYRNQLRIMEVANVEAFIQSGLKHLPYRPCHSLGTPLRSTDRPDSHSTYDFVSIAWYDQHHFITSARQCHALLVKNANIEGRMNGCEVPGSNLLQ
jgi:hypothetical protein